MARSAIDIIIPYHGCYELVAQCIGKIQVCTPNQNYSIILVDDASPNKGFSENLKHFNKKIKIIRLEEQRGFGAAVNAGIAAGNNPFVVVMHSDCEPININWLIELQKSLYDNKGNHVKLVSSRTNIMGTASGFDERLLGNAQDAFDDSTVIAQGPLPLFCCLFHRDLVKKIDGGLKEYPYAWYEDEELFWRMRHYGYLQAIATRSFVYHHGAQTIKYLWNKDPEIKSIMEDNQQLCIRDVGELLPPSLAAGFRPN